MLMTTMLKSKTRKTKLKSKDVDDNNVEVKGVEDNNVERE